MEFLDGGILLQIKILYDAVFDIQTLTFVL